MSELDQAFELHRRGEFDALADQARRITEERFGRKVFLRGLIEYSNRCICSCLYCGIRRENGKVRRYGLSDEAILAAVRSGHDRGLKSFVLQGGEDPAFGPERLCHIVGAIKQLTRGEAAVTLSAGILPREAYAELRRAGADRYLIRFETADPELHQYLRGGITLERRLEALEDLKSLGYQTGSGFMTGLPGETDELLMRNIRLCKELELDMAGIGPFIPHPETPLRDTPTAPVERAIRAVALLRIACPDIHIPATTAAGSLAADGRERMIQNGANVLMPNLTPVAEKKEYLLYPGKICLDEEGLHCIGCLDMRMRSVDRELSFERADGLVAPRRTLEQAV